MFKIPKKNSHIRSGEKTKTKIKSFIMDSEQRNIVGMIQRRKVTELIKLLRLKTKKKRESCM